MKTERGENVEFIVKNCKDRFISSFTTAYPNMFSFGRQLFLRFLLLFEYVFVCWKRYSTKAILALIMKYLNQQTNTYSKSVVETLKQEVKSVKS